MKYLEPSEVCEKAVQWTSAIALLHLLKLEVTPDVITYNAVLSACQKSAQWQRALHLFGEVHDQRIQPTIITCDLGPQTVTEQKSELDFFWLEFHSLWPEIPVLSSNKTRFIAWTIPSK